MEEKSRLKIIFILFCCGEHLNQKSNVGCYIENCPTYQQKYEEFCASNLIDFKTLKQKKDHFLKQYFFILRKCFRSICSVDPTKNCKNIIPKKIFENELKFETSKINYYDQFLSSLSINYYRFNQTKEAKTIRNLFQLYILNNF